MRYNQFTQGEIMSLQSTLTEIKKVQPFAVENVEEGPRETYNARKGRKASAVEQLKRLRSQYRNDMMANSVFIIATGSGRDEFTKVATEEFGLFSADPESFYKDLANRVPPTLYLGKSAVSNIFEILGRHLEDKMLELDINEYNQLIFKAEHAQRIDSVEQFTVLIRNAINKQIGSEIAGLNALESLVDVAIAKDHSDKITPVVLSTGDEQLALDLLRDLERITPRVFLSVTGKSTKALKSLDGALLLKDASKENVEAALTQMRKNLKK
jgi:hypothetical protein